MEIIPTGPEMDKSALIVVDMQNDFVHTDMARQRPGAARRDRRHDLCLYIDDRAGRSRRGEPRGP